MSRRVFQAHSVAPFPSRQRWLSCLLLCLLVPEIANAAPPEDRAVRSGEKPTSAEVAARADSQVDSKDSSKVDPGGITGLPIVSYGPETSLLLGGMLLYRFDIHPEQVAAARAKGEKPARKSVLNLFAAYTLKNQVVFLFDPSLYLDRERWRLSGTYAVVIFPDQLYAPGQDSPASFERYSQRILSGSANLERQVVGQLRLGGGLSATHAQMLESEDGGLLATDQILGSDGGLFLGAGPNIAWDNRDKDTATRSGGRHELSLRGHPQALGGEYGFTQTTVQLRQFIRVWRDQVLAAEIYGRFNYGDVPFQKMAALGGSSRMRGYYRGRYRDHHQVAAQLEYRLPSWWRFGMVGFVGVGNVARKLTVFALDDPKFAGGGGARFALSPKERVNVRIDFAANREGQRNLYIGISEAF